jgi:Zn-dependent M28 family amino/carboxypeptidase
MRALTAVALIAAAIPALSPAQPTPGNISAARLREQTRFLAGDLMEGRGVGTRGGQLATEYIASQLALAGARPAGDHGTYFQRVPLIGVTTHSDASIAVVQGSESTPLEFAREWVGVTQRQVPLVQFDAECVFVGHGIRAPEFNWDDYKDTDVRGKIVVLFTNEPASTDAAFFGGRALTYYGRWVYKYEEAQRRGAAGAIIIHTTPTAGYSWDVVRNSWAKEDPQVKLEAGAHALSIAGWVTQEAGARILKLAGQPGIDELLRAADSRDFRPIPLGLRVHGRLPTTVRDIESRNVAAIIPGSDANLKDEAVVFTAHWDHLGVGTPVNNDAIYNGAVDNATGCAVLLEIARAWASLGARPRRSALFLSVTAEEGGLRGSAYYAQHPIVPPGKTAIDINYDALYPFGRTLDVVVSGAERTTAWPLVQDAARRMRLDIAPDPRPEQGTYFRSDHFSMARVGIPAFTIKTGSRFAGKPAGYSAQIFSEYNSAHYHQPSDEFNNDWDFAGVDDLARLGLIIGIDVANQTRLPAWNPGDEFQAVREKR